MAKISKTIIFFGNERLATGVTTFAPTLYGLIKEGYAVAALVLAQHEQGPSRKKRSLEIAELAKEHNISILTPHKLNDIKDDLLAYGAEAGVLVAYGQLVPQSVIDIFPKGIINIHPSLLPKHRGSTPIESAILNGDRETGVSLMQLGAELDNGPIFGQDTMGIIGMPKQGSADTLNQRGAELVLKYLPQILDGTAEPPKPQDESEATQDSRISKEDGIMDFTKNAERLEREVRAYTGWPRSRTTIADTAVVITEAKIATYDNTGVPGTFTFQDDKLLVYCKWGALEIISLVPAGKKEMSAKAFLAGHNL